MLKIKTEKLKEETIQKIKNFHIPESLIRIFGGLTEKNYNLIKSFIFKDQYSPFRINNFLHIGWPDPYPDWKDE